MNDWLLRKSFTMHSGETSDFKIECDALTDEEIETFAMLIARRFKFTNVIGIPRGGRRIALALSKYRDRPPKQMQWLIVDDVLTTGANMDKHRGAPSDIGVVLFARGPCPDWVHPVFQLWSGA
jgi:orotate phosphoribosyltransferase